jgi:hypothetical protein
MLNYIEEMDFADPRMSPEFAAVRRSSSARNLIAYLLWPFYKVIRRRLYLFRFRKRAYDLEIPWRWENENFNRIAVVTFLLSQFETPRYLEVGCAANSLFSSVPTTSKVGVDPLTGGTHRITSDEFFESNRDKFEIIFIDGLHTYRQIRKDVNNALKSIQLGGYIVLHDTLPRNWIEQNVPPLLPGPWLGDVWKVCFELLETKGIEFKVIRIDYGVAVIRVNELGMKLQDLSESLADQDFEYFFINHLKLPIISYQEFQLWCT